MEFTQSVRATLPWPGVLVLVMLLSLMSGAGSCGEDVEPTLENEEELITTVELTFVGAEGEAVARFRDSDGPGGDAPVVTGAMLRTEATYAFTVAFLNESVQPTSDITAEVREEGDEHQVFFRAVGVALDFASDDRDGAGRPIGLSGTVRTGATGSGQVVVVLRHEPDKAASGVAEGDVTNAGGETDVEVSLPMTIR